QYGQPQYGQPQYGQQYGQPQQPWGAPQYGAPAPPPRRGGAGKVVAVVLGLLGVLVLLGGLGIYWAVSRVSETVAGGSGAGCSVVSAADVDSTLGGTYDLVQLGGTLGDFAGVALDNRVLPQAEVSCWAVESGDGGRLARVARHEGADAARVFTDERTKAMGTTTDQGGGLSVSTQAYFNKDVSAGDQAFCTSGDFAGSAGVLVRRGNVLVYVSTTAAGAGAGQVPDIQFPTDSTAPSAGISFGTDDANCDLAVALAARVS
ncbi:MAG: hypothetical protein AB7J32_09985, partial [Pseudonocardia sp.]